MPDSAKPLDGKPPESAHTERNARSGGADLTAQGDINIGGDVVGRDKIVYEAPAIGVANLHQLPPPPHDFIGREAELTELMRKAETEGVTISGLHGLGGIGKTALALVLADRLRDRYPDAQFYLDLKGTHEQQQKALTVAEALTHVIRAYHPTAQLPEGEAELRGLYQSVLHGQRALLLMDNAADKWQVEPLLPPSSCFLLVTSRQHFTLPGLHARSLDTLTPEDARDLLLGIASRIDGQAEALAKMCGYLPLALRLAGGVMAERVTLRPEDYLRRLEDAQQRLPLVDASLSLSFDVLDEGLQRAWCALSVFPGTFDSAAAAVVWDAETEAAQDWLSELVRYSLVEWNETTARARLHDLARLFADKHLSDATRIDKQWQHAAHYASVLRRAHGFYMQGGDGVLRGLGLFDLERANIEAGQAWAAEHAEADDTAAELCSDYPIAGGDVLDLRQHPRVRIHWLEAALVAARRLKRRDAEGWHMGNLGTAYDSLGEFRRAIEYHEQALTIEREIGDRQGEGTALGNLGVAYSLLGEYRRAIEYHEQALTIDHEIGDRRSEGKALANLGVAYDSLGKFRSGIEYHEQALTIDREIGDRRSEGQALANLGLAYYFLGEYRRAIEYCEQHLTIAREIGDRQGEGETLRYLGSAFRSLGEYRRAIEYDEQALTIAREIGDRRGEGNALGNLGRAYDSLGQHARAIEYHEQHLTIAREIGDRRGDGRALGNLGRAYDSVGQYPRAIEYHEQRLTIAREIGDRRGEGQALGNLGSANYSLKDYERAREYYEQQRAIAQEIGDRLGEANSLWGLALCFDDAHDRRQAIAHAQAALDIFTAIEAPEAQAVRDLLKRWK